MDDIDFQKEAFAQLTKIQLVFLTLIFVGIAADFSVDKSSLDIAREQLAEIRDVVLKWNENWLTESAAKLMQSRPSPSQAFEFTAGPTDTKVVMELPTGAFVIRPMSPSLEAVVEPNRGDPKSRRGKPVIKAPQTLSDFWAIWNGMNGLDGKIQIYTEFDPIDRPPIIKSLFSEQYDWDEKASKASRVPSNSTSSTSPNRHASQVSAIHPSDQEFFKQFAPTHTVTSKFSFKDKSYDIFLFTRGRAHLTMNGQDAFVREHDRKWHLGPANSVFKDLYSISLNFADLSYDKIQLILESEAVRYGEHVSIFGVAMPRGQLACWSLVLTTIVYLYFLIHLQAVVRHLRIVGHVSAYPWIAVLPDRISLVSSLLALCALPTVFGVLKTVSIWQLGSLSRGAKIWLSIAALILVSSAMLAGRLILVLRRTT